MKHLKTTKTATTHEKLANTSSMAIAAFCGIRPDWSSTGSPYNTMGVKRAVFVGVDFKSRGIATTESEIVYVLRSTVLVRMLPKVRTLYMVMRCGANLIVCG